MLEVFTSADLLQIVSRNMKIKETMSLLSTCTNLDIMKEKIWYSDPITITINPIESRIYNRLLTLKLNDNYNEHIVLPQNLMRLIVGYLYNQPLTLPPGLKFLELGFTYNQPLVIPANLKFLSIGPKYSQPLILPLNFSSLPQDDPTKDRIYFED